MVLGKNRGPKHKNQKDPRANAQKDPNWTVGTIFKKLMGLLAKFWTKLQILLTRGGLRVEY